MLSKVRSILKSWKDESGQVLILAAIAFALVCAISGFIIDMGRVTIEKSSFQNALDACALAAAIDLPDTEKAADTAEQYIQKNGYSPSDISISFSDQNYTVSISGTKRVEYTFAKVIGINSANVMTAASATKKTLGAAFGYTLFSGDPSYPLTMTGSGQYIGGSAHTNYKLTMTGSSQTITGSAEAVSSITITGSGITIGGICEAATIKTTGSGIVTGAKVYTAAPTVGMPDFSEAIKKQAEASGHSYTGDQTFNGSFISVDHPMYVDGNVTICGSQFTGKGCIAATGNITFTGSGLTSSGSEVCFYSKNGNISLTGSGAVVDGIIYAPNGTVAITGTGVTVNGRIIGNRLSLTGSGYRIVSGENDLDCLPAASVSLTK